LLPGQRSDFGFEITVREARLVRQGFLGFSKIRHDAAVQERAPVQLDVVSVIQLSEKNFSDQAV
jgi:hypothetical protein